MHTITRARVLSLRSSARTAVVTNAAPRTHLSFARSGDAHSVSESEAPASRSRLHTSPRSLVPASTKPPHNADTYSKDVDDSPPSSTKTYEVDADGSASRPNERLNQALSSSSSNTSSKTEATSSETENGEDEGEHTPDSYFKDVDSSPPSSTKTYEVDADGSAARPNEQFGDPNKTYANMSKESLYEQNWEMKEHEEQRLGYGGVKKEKNAEKDAPKRGEGPNGRDAGGRKA